LVRVQVGGILQGQIVYTHPFQRTVQHHQARFRQFKLTLANFKVFSFVQACKQQPFSFEKCAHLVTFSFLFLLK
jgi:hypothetical protein